MTVTVWVGDAPVQLAPGKELAIGRDPGRGQVGADDRTVSRTHGVISAASDHWLLQATGTRSGLVVYDHDTPSRLLLSRGVGPVVVPFASASVVIELRQTRYSVTVAGPGAAGWAGSWASATTDPAPMSSPGATRMPWDDVRWRDPATGKPFRWYQTLVAMCEPFLVQSQEAVVPTDAELAVRLGTTVRVIQSRLMSQVRDQLGFDRYTPHLRQTMVSISISQRLVTMEDLSVLEQQ